MLPAFTSESAIGNLWSIHLGLNILRFELSETLTMQTMHANILGSPFPWIVSYIALATIEEQSLNDLITACYEL